MKEYKTTAHINSLKGEMAEIMGMSRKVCKFFGLD